MTAPVRLTPFARTLAGTTAIASFAAWAWTVDQVPSVVGAIAQWAVTILLPFGLIGGVLLLAVMSAGRRWGW